MRGASAYAHAQAQQQRAECEKGRDLRAISAADLTLLSRFRRHYAAAIFASTDADFRR
jgi:hypothetical protein